MRSRFRFVSEIQGMNLILYAAHENNNKNNTSVCRKYAPLTITIIYSIYGIPHRILYRPQADLRMRI